MDTTLASLSETSALMNKVTAALSAAAHSVPPHGTLNVRLQGHWKGGEWEPLLTWTMTMETCTCEGSCVGSATVMWFHSSNAIWKL